MYCTYDLTVEIVRVSGHAGILGNKIADHLALSTNNLMRFPILKINFSDFLSIIKLQAGMVRL